MQSPIARDCLKVAIGSHTDKFIVPKLPLYESFRGLQYIMVGPPGEGVLKEAIYKENNIIIGYSALKNILPPQLKTISERYKVTCGCECCIYDKNVHSSSLSWCHHHLKQCKDQSFNAQNRRSSEI